MNMQPMKPSPYTSSGELFYVTCCRCGERVKSNDVDCDMDGKAGDYYCQHCSVLAQIDYERAGNATN